VRMMTCLLCRRFAEHPVELGVRAAWSYINIETAAGRAGRGYAEAGERLPAAEIRRPQHAKAEVEMTGLGVLLQQRMPERERLHIR